MVLRKRIYELLEVSKPGDTLSRYFDIFTICLIGSNVVALIFQSVDSIYNKAPKMFVNFEYVSVTIFSLEYILRIWSCVENREYKNSISGRLRFSVTPLILIDLFAILPFYLPFTALDLRFLRAIRLMRILRLAKLGRYSQSLRVLKSVLSQKKEQLVSAVFILLLLLVIASSMMYFIESRVQPESFSSIPATMWLTTAGYGDSYPATILGKIISSITTILGIGMFALPTGILGAGFVEEIERKKTVRICPHCGKKIKNR